VSVVGILNSTRYSLLANKDENGKVVMILVNKDGSLLVEILSYVRFCLAVIIRHCLVTEKIFSLYVAIYIKPLRPQ